MTAFSSRIRRFLPSMARLSHLRAVTAPLEALDGLVTAIYGDLRGLPPNRLRLRVGVENRILLNHVHHLMLPVPLWIDAFARGLVTLESTILDLGCGCGRYARVLRDHRYFDSRFEGRYLGLDVDGEMIDWCRAHFPADRFTFERLEARSSLYNPGGAEDPGLPRFPAGDDSVDFTLATSLFSHLLPREFRHYLGEVARVMKPGGCLHATAFCLEHIRAAPRSRWTFRHRRDEAYLESERIPEAAVAYTESWLRETCAAAGLGAPELRPTPSQSLLRCRKPARAASGGSPRGEMGSPEKPARR